MSNDTRSRPYNASGSLIEYGVFPECDAPQPAGDGCHCATCTCDPNMTPAVRFDLSPAQPEGAIREHLIRLGWTPPADLLQPAEGEEIMVNTPYDVFTLPLRPSGLSSGPRFVVHVPAQPAASAEYGQFLTDVMTAAGLVSHGKQCKALGERLGAAAMKYMLQAPATSGSAEWVVRPAEQPAEQHPDDAAVDRFAAAMKAKLKKKRQEGRGGWQSMTSKQLSALLHEHVRKGDPVDVANLAMMLHQNGQVIEPPATVVTDEMVEALRAEVERLQEIVRPKREDECLTLDHWRMRAYALEANWARCSYACAGEQTKREQAEARADKLAEALAGLITWIPSADTYRRLGFDPGAPMRALAKARTVLAKGGKEAGND